MRFIDHFILRSCVRQSLHSVAAEWKGSTESWGVWDTGQLYVIVANVPQATLDYD